MSCPNAETLERFARDGSAAAPDLHEHLAVCAPCRSRLEEIRASLTATGESAETETVAALRTTAADDPAAPAGQANRAFGIPPGHSRLQVGTSDAADIDRTARNERRDPPAPGQDDQNAADGVPQGWRDVLRQWPLHAVLPELRHLPPGGQREFMARVAQAEHAGALAVGALLFLGLLPGLLILTWRFWQVLGPSGLTGRAFGILVTAISWLVAAAVAHRLILVGNAWWDRRRLRSNLRSALLERGILTCVRCGYDLRGVASLQCSECGTPSPVRSYVVVVRGRDADGEYSREARIHWINSSQAASMALRGLQRNTDERLAFVTCRDDDGDPTSYPIGTVDLGPKVYGQTASPAARLDGG